MANNENSNISNIPSNASRLSNKFKKIKDGIVLRTYEERTEDKGGDVEVVEAEKDGRIVSRFVKKDGKIVESMGSEDAQSSGKFSEIAKKIGGSDSITYTKPEQVSKIANEKQADSVRKNTVKPDKVVIGSPSADHKLDNNREAELEAEFINNKKPQDSEKIEKSGIHYGSQEGSMSYRHYGVPRPPKMNKTVENKVLKKWEVFMDSMKGFKEPLRKPEDLEKGKKIKNTMYGLLMLLHPETTRDYGQPVKEKSKDSTEQISHTSDHVDDSDNNQKNLKKDEDPKKTDKRSGPMGMWDILNRKKQSSDTRTTQQKIRDALDKQKAAGSPYAERRLNIGAGLSSKGDDDPKFKAAIDKQSKKESGSLSPNKEKPVSSTGIPNVRLASTTDEPKKRPGRKKTSHIKVVKSMFSLIENLRKSNVVGINNKKEKNIKKQKEEQEKRELLIQQAKEKQGIDPEGVPFKFWKAFREQARKKQMQETAKKIPLPNIEIQPHPPEVIDVDPEIIKNMNEKLKDVPKTKKSSVSGASKKPTQDASGAPTIKNAVETTGPVRTQVTRNEGLAKDKKDLKIDPNIMPQHLPSAENGLDEHLRNLQNTLHKHEKALRLAQVSSSYGKDVPKAKRDRNMKMAERTMKYLQQGIEMTKLAIATRDSKAPMNTQDLVKQLIGTGNPKVNQMGVLTFGNTLPGHHCPARGGCGDGSCYGMNGQQAMGNALKLRARNSGLVHRADFADLAIHALKNAPKKIKVDTSPDMYENIKDLPRFKDILLSQPKNVQIINKKTGKATDMVRFHVKSGDIVRWHDTGDIVNEKHLNDIVKIAKAFPEKKFYLYTKSMHLPLERLRSLPNFNVIQSFGGKHNNLIDTSKPHAKYFKSIDDATANGYSPVWYHDWDAASGVNKLALVPHGSRLKEIDVGGYNKGVGEYNKDIKDNENISIPPVEKVKKSNTHKHTDYEPSWMTFDQPDAIAQSAAMGAHGKMRAIAMLHHEHDYNKELAKASNNQDNRDGHGIDNQKRSIIQKPEYLQKDIINIKTGRKLKETQKRIDAQQKAGVGTSSGFPTPTPVKEVNGKIEYSEVSDKIADKFKKMRDTLPQTISKKGIKK